jgi:hypothetical protein
MCIYVITYLLSYVETNKDDDSSHNYSLYINACMYFYLQRYLDIYIYICVYNPNIFIVI